MTDAFEDLLRSTLSDIAEEAPTVQDPLNEAERRVRHRRRLTVALSAAGVVAALAIGAPLAFADGGGDDLPVQPANTAPSPSPSPTTSGGPAASPSPTVSGGPLASPSPVTPGGPLASPSPVTPGGPAPSPSPGLPHGASPSPVGSGPAPSPSPV